MDDPAQPPAAGDDILVLFDEDFDYDHPALSMTTLAFHAGQELGLSRSIAEAAIAAGKAHEVQPQEPPDPSPSSGTEDHAEG